MLKTIRVHPQYELTFRRNDPQGCVASVLRIDAETAEGGRSLRDLGYLYTYRHVDETGELFHPHWAAHVYFFVDEAISEEVGRAIGNCLLSETSCEEPMGLSGIPFLPSNGSVDDKSFFIEYGNVFTED